MQENESMDITVEEKQGEEFTKETHVTNLGQVSGRVGNLEEMDTPGMVAANNLGSSGATEAATSMETISNDKEVVIDRQILRKENMGISLENISLYSKDKELKKIGLRASNNLRVNLETASRISHPRIPKFKKGPSRKLSAHRAVGKENIPVGGQVVAKLGCGKSVQPSIPDINGGLGDPKPPNHSDLSYPSGNRDLCRTGERRPVDDSDSSIGKSGLDGVQLLSTPGEHCVVLNDDTGISFHHRWTNESAEGVVPCNDA